MGQDQHRYQEDDDQDDGFRSLLIIGTIICLVAGAAIGFWLSTLLHQLLYP